MSLEKHKYLEECLLLLRGRSHHSFSSPFLYSQPVALLAELLFTMSISYSNQNSLPSNVTMGLPSSLDSKQAKHTSYATNETPSCDSSVFEQSHRQELHNSVPEWKPSKQVGDRLFTNHDESKY
jgi:hypothetical protein